MKLGFPPLANYTQIHGLVLLTDIAMLVLEKCTKEKNDRDDINFAMSFDYEFVEDFHMKEEPLGASNEIFSNMETDSADVYFGEDDVEGLELRQVVTHTDTGKRTKLRNTTGTKM